MIRRKHLSAPERFENRFCFDGAGIADALVIAADQMDTAEGEPQPEFSLEDVNATSATFGQSLSPSDFRDGVSAWYFGHAT